MSEKFKTDMHMDELQSERFYDLMQHYRHVPAWDQEAVCAAFEAVKRFIRGATFIEDPDVTYEVIGSVLSAGESK